MIEPHGHSPIVGQIERTKGDLVGMIVTVAWIAGLALIVSVVALCIAVWGGR